MSGIRKVKENMSPGSRRGIRLGREASPQRIGHRQWFGLAQYPPLEQEAAFDRRLEWEDRVEGPNLWRVRSEFHELGGSLRGYRVSGLFSR